MSEFIICNQTVPKKQWPFQRTCHRHKVPDQPLSVAFCKYSFFRRNHNVVFGAKQISNRSNGDIVNQKRSWMIDTP